MNDFTRPDPPSQTAYPVARAGFPFIFTASFATVVFALLGFTGLAIFGMVVSLFICFFFRDPDRLVPNTLKGLVSPADGKIIAIEQLETSPFYEGPCQKISIFMTVFNVHVNRVPSAGTVREIKYFPGKFFSANLDKASKENEHNAVFLETDAGQRICMVQIAGLIARRIICYIREGDRLTTGQRMGLICFGSRVDVYFPKTASVLVCLGDRVCAGTTLLGTLQ
jgi:phosphatidylserine decarboxylase